MHGHIKYVPISTYLDYHHGRIDHGAMVAYTLEERQKRIRSFLDVCLFFHCDNNLKRIIRVVPKRKDGQLMKKRVTRICYLDMSNDEGYVCFLAAVNRDDVEVALEVRFTYFRPEEFKGALTADQFVTLLAGLPDHVRPV